MLQTINQKKVRSIILFVISLVTYWTEPAQKKLKDTTALWMPDDLDGIPLQTMGSDDMAAEETTILYLPNTEEVAGRDP